MSCFSREGDFLRKILETLWSHLVKGFFLNVWDRDCDLKIETAHRLVVVSLSAREDSLDLSFRFFDLSE